MQNKSNAVKSTVEIFPILIAFSSAGLSVRAVFQSKNRMKFPIRYPSKRILDGVFGVEHQLPCDPNQESLLRGFGDQRLHRFSAKLRMTV
jgi:hypothetical protein